MSYAIADPKLRPGTRFCQCATCGAYFTGLEAFDKHRVGDWDHRRCLTSTQMQHRGLALSERGYWGRPQREVNE